MSEHVPLSQPYLNDLEPKFLLDAIGSGWLTQSGPYVKQMEDLALSCVNQADFANSKKLTSTSNGTTALHLALLSIGIKAGDEVLVPDFSYIAPVNAVLMCNATPVAIDVDPESWCINPELAAEAVTNKTKAIIAVDNYGRLADIPRLRELLPDSIVIIQDAAESFPGPLGRSSSEFLGDFVTMSFYANKIVTSAEGGAVYGPSEFIDKICSLKNQSVKAKGAFEHIDIGYNYRISNIHAALFVAQWEKLSEILEMRNRVFKDYFKYMSLSNLNFTTNQILGDTNPWLFTIKLPESKLHMPEIREALSTFGIETRPGFKPASLHDYLNKSLKIGGSLSVSHALHSEIISLPTYPELESKTIRYICDSLIKAISK